MEKVDEGQFCTTERAFDVEGPTHPGLVIVSENLPGWSESESTVLVLAQKADRDEMSEKTAHCLDVGTDGASEVLGSRVGVSEMICDSQCGRHTNRHRRGEVSHLPQVDPVHRIGDPTALALTDDRPAPRPRRGLAAQGTAGGLGHPHRHNYAGGAEHGARQRRRQRSAGGLDEDRRHQRCESPEDCDGEVVADGDATEADPGGEQFGDRRRSDRARLAKCCAWFVDMWLPA